MRSCFGCLRRRRNNNNVLRFVQRTRVRVANNNWEKKGHPRFTRITPYTMKRNLTNNISLENFKNGNIVYMMFRNKLGKVPVAYTENSLRGLIKSGNYGSHLGSNLNNFLARVKNNAILFKNTQTREPRKRKHIRKVILINERKTR